MNCGGGGDDDDDNGGCTVFHFMSLTVDTHTYTHTVDTLYVLHKESVSGSHILYAT